MTTAILLRVILSVSANAIQKRLLLDRAGVIQTWILTYSIMLLPATALALLQPIPTEASFWRDILIGGGLDALGNLAMVAALRWTDVSVFGPLNAFRPILALAFGWIFLNETPSPVGLCGIGVTVFGAVALLTNDATDAERPRETLVKALALRTLGLSLGVAGAVFLKRAATVGSPQATVAAWIFFGLLVTLAFAAIRHRAALSSIKAGAVAHRKWLVTHSAVFLTMQLVTIFIFQSTLLAYSFVFFQLGMVLQVFVGRYFFQEPAFVRRMIAAVVMALGSALIIWKG